MLTVAAPPVVKPVKIDQGVLLVDAAQHDLATFRNYTASWRAGSDLVPEVTKIRDENRSWFSFRFRGTQGLACSTVYFSPLPEADEGYQYDGITLILDCDRDDFPHMGVQISFSDKSQLSCDLTLEQGVHEYTIQRGFRRVKYPPRWDLIQYIMLSLDATRHDTTLSYRLERITVRQSLADKLLPSNDVSVPDLFAQPVLLPQPKQVQWKQAAFAARAARSLSVPSDATDRTRRTAQIFADRYFGFTGVRLQRVARSGEPPSDEITLQLADDSDHPSSKQLRPQGYRLEVAPDRVVITGADEPGLYYGTVTFFQLLRHAWKDASEQLAVPCVVIDDWPDTLHRLIRLEHPGTFRNYRVRENRGIDYLIDWTDRFVAGCKFNTLYIDLSSNVRYERRSEFDGTEKIYSLADLRRFGQFCRDHFIDLCPAWQVGGHANWWLTIGYHPELREKGWKNQGDVTHPDHDAVVYDCMLDVIEALQPKYVSPKSDEWWSTPQPDEKRDALLGGKSAQAFLDSHVKLNNWLRRQGITMMIFEDMLSPYHNGKRFDVYRTIDAFPKDVILTQWSDGNADKEIRYFTDRGFRVWPNATSMLTLSDDAKSRVMGFGKGIYPLATTGITCWMSTRLLRP